MATKQEMIDGMEFVRAQAKRVAGLIDPGDWDLNRPQGWTPKEMFAHVAVTAATIPAMGAGLLAAPENVELTSGLDIGALNEQGVSSLRAVPVEQVLEALDNNYVKLIDWTKGLNDEQLAGKKTFLTMTMPGSDLLMTLTVMHAVHHVYEAGLRVAI
ncbi:MAG: hypothetical protein AAB092_03770 [Chloroflexota bacterium]